MLDSELFIKSFYIDWDKIDEDSYLVSAFGSQKALQPVDCTDIFGCLWYTGNAKKNVVLP
jgi:hypothetical protein